MVATVPSLASDPVLSPQPSPPMQGGEGFDLHRISPLRRTSARAPEEAQPDDGPRQLQRGNKHIVRFGVIGLPRHALAPCSCKPTLQSFGGACGMQISQSPERPPIACDLGQWPSRAMFCAPPSGWCDCGLDARASSRLITLQGGAGRSHQEHAELGGRGDRSVLHPRPSAAHGVRMAARNVLAAVLLADAGLSPRKPKARG